MSIAALQVLLSQKKRDWKKSNATDLLIQVFKITFIYVFLKIWSSALSSAVRANKWIPHCPLFPSRVAGKRWKNVVFVQHLHNYLPTPNRNKCSESVLLAQRTCSCSEGTGATNNISRLWQWTRPAAEYNSSELYFYLPLCFTYCYFTE